MWPIAVVFVSTFPARPAVPRPLWPGSPFTEQQRSRALARGLAFIYRTALDPANFQQYGSDYLWCFYEIAATSADRDLRAQAEAMGHERAIVWRREHAHVAADLSADDLADLLFGAYAAEQLGFRDDRLKDEIRRAAARFTPRDYLRFDPALGPPPDDSALDDLLCDALITTYTADQYGVMLGAPYPQIAKWLKLVRPYRTPHDGIIPVVNLVTHVVYTTNDYDAHAVTPEALPDEFTFLKAHMFDREIVEDVEMMGEFMDTLRGFGLTTSDDLIRRGFSQLLAAQNPDGSWGDMHSRDIYNRYHPTWTVIDGLRDYRWSR